MLWSFLDSCLVLTQFHTLLATKYNKIMSPRMCSEFSIPIKQHYQKAKIKLICNLILTVTHLLARPCTLRHAYIASEKHTLGVQGLLAC